MGKKEFNKELTTPLSPSYRKHISWKPENVTRALAHAVTAEKQRQYVVVGIDGRFLLSPLLLLSRRYVLGQFGQRMHAVPPAPPWFSPSPCPSPNRTHTGFATASSTQSKAFTAANRRPSWAYRPPPCPKIVCPKMHAHTSHRMLVHMATDDDEPIANEKHNPTTTTKGKEDLSVQLLFLVAFLCVFMHAPTASWRYVWWARFNR